MIKTIRRVVSMPLEVPGAGWSLETDFLTPENLAVVSRKLFESLPKCPACGRRFPPDPFRGRRHGRCEGCFAPFRKSEISNGARRMLWRIFRFGCRYIPCNERQDDRRWKFSEFFASLGEYNRKSGTPRFYNSCTCRNLFSKGLVAISKSRRVVLTLKGLEAVKMWRPVEENRREEPVGGELTDEALTASGL